GARGGRPPGAAGRSARHAGLEAGRTRGRVGADDADAPAADLTRSPRRGPDVPKVSRVDAYLETLAPPRRAVVQRLRQTVAAAAPDAVESIAYDRPAFRR